LHNQILLPEFGENCAKMLYLNWGQLKKFSRPILISLFIFFLALLQKETKKYSPFKPIRPHQA